MSILYPVAGLTAGGIMIWSGLNGVSVIDTVLGVAKPKKGTNPADSLLNNLGIPGGGGSGGGSGVPVGGTSWRQMFPAHAVFGRTDEGVDITMSPGDPIKAPAPSRLMGVISNWYAGQPYVWYQVTSGPDRGVYYYVAEQFAPVTTRSGATFNTGDVLGHYAASGTAIEAGLAVADGRTLAKATTGYTEGQETAAGKQFRSKLGV